MLAALAVLTITDGAIALVGVALARARRFGDAPPLTLVVGAMFLAFLAHASGYVACQAALAFFEVAPPDTSTRMVLFVSSLIAGVGPAIVFGYLLVKSLANSIGNKMSMMEREPDSVSTDAFFRVRAMTSHRNFEGALTECRRLADEHPKSALPLIEMALVYERADCAKEAAETLRTVLQRFAANDDMRNRATFHLAHLLSTKLNDPAGAAELLERLQPNRRTTAPQPLPRGRFPLSVHLSEARLYAKRGDTDAAVAAYRAVYRTMPEEPKPAFEAASLLERESRFDDAANVLREVLRTGRKGGEAWSMAALRLARLLEGRFDAPESAEIVLRDVMANATRAEHTLFARDRLNDITHRPAP